MVVATRSPACVHIRIRGESAADVTRHGSSNSVREREREKESGCHTRRAGWRTFFVLPATGELGVFPARITSDFRCRCCCYHSADRLECALLLSLFLSSLSLFFFGELSCAREDYSRRFGIDSFCGPRMGEKERKKEEEEEVV